jgi:hypothetical protein
MTIAEQAIQKETEAVVAYLRHKVAEGAYYGYEDSAVDHSRLDGLLTRRGSVAAGVEVKWRRYDWENLVGYHKGEMLVPSDKLMAGQALAYAFGVPTLLLYLLADCLVAQTVVAANGDRVNVVREVYEQSDRSTECSGVVRRKNSYISIEEAEKIPIGL